MTLEPTTVAVGAGDTFTVHALVRNAGPVTSTPLLAHLDVVSLQTDVYVDPEDWSSSRTRSVPALSSGGAATVTWEVKAVNSGRFDLHVVVLPVLTGRAGPVAVSTPTYVTVTSRQTLNPGGSLGVVFAVPVAVGLGALVLRRSQRRRS